jgi:hypothetical protein
MTDSTLTTLLDFGVFTLDQELTGLDAIEGFYRRYGFVVLRDVLGADLTDRMDVECAQAQRQVLAGEVDERYGAAQYLDDESKI